jgi:hypothetical protein
VKSKKSVDYIILIPGKNFPYQFVLSLIETISYLLQNGHSYYISIKSLALVSSLRNSLISQDFINGSFDNVEVGESPTVFNNTLIVNKKILMFDSDMCWTLDDLKYLMHNDNDITVGGYKTLGGTVCINFEEEHMSAQEFKSFDKPFEVKAAGLGFASVKQKVFESIEYPWFKVDEGKSFSSMIGEDVYFFRKAREAGFKVICDPRIRPGHVKDLALYI